MAHVEMLAAQGILNDDEMSMILQGLEAIRKEISTGNFPYDLSFEDIHMNIEKRLTEKIGPVGGKLHTGRSRNDQVALDLHLYMKREITLLDSLLLGLQKALLEVAEENLDVLIPGYTHLQRAQPVLLAHHFLAYFWMISRDRKRLQGTYEHADLMPLGAGAIAGTGFPINRRLVAEKLGFNHLYANSIDAISDRDYVIEFLSFASILMMHLSRLCEELVLWSSAEFNFIDLDDAYTTGSSMMPQKKNPDVAELIRAKSGRVYGNLLSILTVMKALPLSYNKDMQEDKEGLFDTIDTLKSLLPLLAEMLLSMIVNRKRLSEAVDDDYLCATDLADHLVKQGVTFRDSHHIVGNMIAHCVENNLRLSEIEPEVRSGFHPALADDISDLFDPLKVAEARTSYGGTASSAVKDQLKEAHQVIAKA